MNCELTYDEERDLIVGRIYGEFDSSVVMKMTTDLAAMVRRHGCSRVLNDLRGATITSATLSICNMPRVVDQAGVPIKCKRALIIREASADFHFLETAFVNIGQEVRIFTDRDDAIEWLTDSTKTPDKPDAGDDEQAPLQGQTS